MFPGKNGKGVEELARNNPKELLNKLGSRSGHRGSGVGPVPEGVDIVDSPETRDASYPTHQNESK